MSVKLPSPRFKWLPPGSSRPRVRVKADQVVPADKAVREAQAVPADRVAPADKAMLVAPAVRVAKAGKRDRADLREAEAA